jgi:hypothetical protein
MVGLLLPLHTTKVCEQQEGEGHLDERGGHNFVNHEEWEADYDPPGSPTHREHD